MTVRSTIVIVAGHLRVATADQALVVERSRSSVAAARAAEGCLDFVVAADPLEATRVNVFERWADRSSLEAFRGSGPDDDVGSLIQGYAVEEYEATPSKG